MSIIVGLLWGLGIFSVVCLLLWLILAFGDEILDLIFELFD